MFRLFYGRNIIDVEELKEETVSVACYTIGASEVVPHRCRWEEVIYGTEGGVFICRYVFPCSV